MNDSKVAVHTGKEVEEHLSGWGEEKNCNSHRHQYWEVSFGPAKENNAPKKPHNLNGSQVVGEDVEVAGDRVGTLLPPPLEGLAEDEKAEREDKEAAGDGEAEDGVTARRWAHA